jgi:hypothetical protein
MPENFDVGKSLSHAWKTLEPIMEWTSTIVDKGYMISDFLINKRQKGVDAKYAFGKAESEAYKILEAEQSAHGKLAKRSDKKEEKKEDKEDHADWSDPREFVNWLKERDPEEVLKWAEDMSKTIADEAKKIRDENLKKGTPTKKDKSS